MYSSTSVTSLRFIAFLALIISALPAHAVRVTDLYEAMVPVESQSTGLRAPALRGILRAVVTKVTGRSVLPKYFTQSISVKHLVEQFGYESRQVNNKRQLYLWGRLNPAGVKRIVRGQGLPVWPEERPTTLVWLALEDKAGRQVIAEDSEHDVMGILRQAASRRGLPVILPLMDLSESASVNFASVTAMSPGALAGVSQKYSSQHVLVGHIQRENAGLWRGRWQLGGSAKPPVVTPLGPLQDVIAAGINPLASQIAQQFASFSFSDSPQYIEVTVDDIQGAADYGRSLNYLKSLSLVTQVDVVGSDRGGVNFRLHTRADIASVMQVISIGRVLYARDTIDQLVFGLNP